MFGLEWVTCSLLQRIFPTLELNPGLLHCRWILYQLSHKGSPYLGRSPLYFYGCQSLTKVWSDKTSEKSQNLQEREVHLKNTEVAHIPSPFPCTPPSSTKLDFLSTPTGREPSMSLAVGGLWSQQETCHLQSPVILQWQVQHPVGLQQTHYYLCDCSALFYLYKDLICSHWKIMFNGEKFVTICCKKKGGYKAIHKIILFL